MNHAPSPSGPGQRSGQTITFGHLQDRYVDDAKRANVDPQVISNHRYALKLWLESQGKTPDSCIGDAFDNDVFATGLRQHQARMKARGYADPTINSHGSWIGDWKHFFDELVQALRIGVPGLPTGFRPRLQALCRMCGVTAWQLARATGLTGTKVFSWVSGERTPAVESREGVEKIEDFFKVPRGTLWGEIQQPRGTCRDLAKKGQVRKTKYARLQAQRRQLPIHPFLTRNKLPGPLLAQAGGYADFKKMEESEIDARRELGEEIDRQDHWTTRNGACETEKVFWSHIGQLYGYFSLPTEISPEVDALINERFVDEHPDFFYTRVWARDCVKGPGIPAEQCSLALISDSVLCLRFIEYQHRNAGVYHRGTLRHLQSWTEMTRPKTGWLWQHPELQEQLQGESLQRFTAFVARLPAEIANDPKARWRAWTEKNWTSYKGQARKLIKDKAISMSRHPSQPVATVWDDDYPMQILDDLFEAMLRKPPSPTAKMLSAVHKRNLVIVGFMRECPLRVRNLAELGIGDHDQLYRSADGGWSVKLPRAAMKNARYMKEEFFEATLSDELTRCIDDYLANGRPLLKGGDVPDCHFLLLKRRTGRRDGDRRGWIGLAVAKAANRHLGITIFPNIGRHLTATTILKTNNNDYYAAAAKLGNDPETTKHYYSFLKQRDHAKRGSDALNQARLNAQKRRDDQRGAP